MSVEDMLAAARGNKPAAGEQATEPEEEVAAAPTDDAPSGQDATEDAAKQLPTGTDEIVAFCRKVDGGG